MSPKTHKSDDKENQPVEPGSPENAAENPLEPEEVARTLSSFAAFLRETGNDDESLDIDGAATSARMAIEKKEAEEILEGEEGTVEDQNKLPGWAPELDNIRDVFIKKREQTTGLDLWEPVVEKTSRQENAKLEVKFQRSLDILTPGGTKYEQGIPLEPLDNTFTVPEWNKIVKPVMEKLIKSIELRRLSMFKDEYTKDFRNRVKMVMPSIIGRKQTEALIENETTEEQLRQKIRSVVNEIILNPDILRNWIKVQIRKENLKEIPVKIGRSHKNNNKKIEIKKENLGKKFLPLKTAAEEEAEAAAWAIKPLKTAEKAIAEELQRAIKGPYNIQETIRRKKTYKEVQDIREIEEITDQFEEDKKKTLDEYVESMLGKISSLGHQLLYLNTKFTGGIYKVPEVKKDYVETPYISSVLTKLTKKVSKQLEKKKGMVSIIGDMGTGKNYIVEHFAAKTNRPFFYFPCSRGYDAADLGFHFEYRKGESVVLPSALAKGLQTKNSVILIDEPNALQPEVISALHGLADHNRAFVYDGITFNAAEGVVIIMAMNPATYAHVKSLPEAMKDRTLGQDMVMNYPPLTRLDKIAYKQKLKKAEREALLQEDNTLDKYYECDEALILRNEFPELKKYSNEEFSKLWEVIINQESPDLVIDFEPEFEKFKSDFEAILKILLVCDAWRKKYPDQMNRTISIRGAIAVCENYQELKDVRKAFLDLYEPNSLAYDGGTEDYEKLQQILNDTAELEKTLNEILTK